MVVIGGRGELGGKDERAAKNGLGRGGVGDVVGCGAVGEKEPGQVGGPVGVVAAGAEGGFEGAMESLYHPV